MKALLLSATLLCAAAPAWPRAGGGGGGGGCFPAGTLILTAEGQVPIEDIRAGDRVLAFSDDLLMQVEVENFIKKKDRLVKIRTYRGTLTATLEHPLLTRYGFTEVRELKKGDTVAVLRDGRRIWTKIRSIKPGDRAEVFNLEVAPPHTFIADGFIVHNKGGGGYHSSSYSRGSYGRRYGMFDYVFLGGALLFIWIKKLFSKDGSSRYGIGRLSPASVASKAGETRAIMESLGRRDPDFNPEALENSVRDIFIKVQEAWQARDYSALGGIMMPNLRASYSSKVEAMKTRGEVNMMEDVQVLKVEFVQVRSTTDKAGRSFTALISASARDYTIAEGTGSLISGTRDAGSFQEFWTFQKFNEGWALARVDQVGEFDLSSARNLPDSPATDAAFSAPAAAAPAPAFGAAAPGMATPGFQPLFLGAAPPPAQPAPAAGYQPRSATPLPSAEARKVSGDTWDRQHMEIAATLAFESVYTAWGHNDSSLLKADFISTEALARLKSLMEARKKEGLSFEFNNLFTRRAEVVLTSSAQKSPLHRDEFTARINATAVRAMLRNGRPLHRDAAPEPFTEYWVFGRQKDNWKLRDILPRMDQESHSEKDGAPSPVQIEWYWSSTKL